MREIQAKTISSIYISGIKKPEAQVQNDEEMITP